MGLDLLQQGDDIIVQITQFIASHSSASCHSKPSQIDQVHVEPIQGVLQRTFQENIRILAIAMHYAHSGFQLTRVHPWVPDIRVISEHVVADACTENVLSFDFKHAYLVLSFMDFLYEVEAKFVVLQFIDA